MGIDKGCLAILLPLQQYSSHIRTMRVIMKGCALWTAFTIEKIKDLAALSEAVKAFSIT